MPGHRRAQRLASGLIVVAATAALAAQGVNWNLSGGAPPAMPIGDRTKSLLAVLTPAQRYHSTLFRQYTHPGNPITETLQSIAMQFEPEISGTLDALLRERICTGAGSAFEGTALSAESHPIDDGSFLFTDYALRVTKVFREPPHRRLRPGDSIVVGAPGGQMIIAGEPVSATSNIDAFLTQGSSYLIFASYSAEFRVFDTAAPIFAVDDTNVRTAAREVMLFPSDFSLNGTLVRRDFEDRIAKAARCGR